MFDAIISFFRSLFAQPQQQELLIPVRVERKKDQLRRR